MPSGFCPKCGIYVSFGENTISFICRGCNGYIKCKDLHSKSISGDTAPTRAPSVSIMGNFYTETPEGVFEKKYAERRKIAKELRRKVKNK